MKLCRLMTLALAVLLMPASALIAQKEAKGSIESKLALESSMENRLKKVLTEITGTEKIVIIVNVQLAAEKKETQEAAKKENDFILPGVPIKEAINEKQVGEAVMAALGEDTRTLINKLTVTIILDKGVSQGVINIVKEVATGLLGIDPARGDQLVVKQMSFQKNPFYWGMLFYPPNVYWVILIAAACVLTAALVLFLFGPFKIFTTDFVKGLMATASAVKESGKAPEENPEAAVPAGTAAALMGPDPASSLSAVRSSVSGSTPFSFVNARNLGTLLYLTKDAPAENIAAIANYLPPDLSSRLLSALPADKQRETAEHLARVKELDASEIDNLEAKLKKRIGYLSGGAEKLVSILDYADDKTRTAVLGAVKNVDPQAAEQVQKSIVSVEMLAGMDASSIAAVIKAVTPVVFGQVLKALKPEIQEKVLKTLPEGAAARLRQEMEMGKPFNQTKLELEKKHIIEVIKRLEAWGLITRQ